MALVVGLGAASTYLALTDPLYRATVEGEVIVDSTSSSPEEIAAAVSAARGIASATAATATTPMVMEAVIRALDLPGDADGLAARVQATSAPDSAIIRVTAGDTDPAAARAIAASTLVQLENDAARRNELVVVETVRGEGAATMTVSPQPVQALAVGGLLGVGLGAMVLAWMIIGSRRVETATDIDRLTGARVLGVVNMRASSAPAVSDALTLAEMSAQEGEGGAPLVLGVPEPSDVEAVQRTGVLDLTTDRRWAPLSQAILTMTSAQLIGLRGSGVAVVVFAGVTRKASLIRAVDLLEGSGARVLGVVLVLETNVRHSETRSKARREPAVGVRA